MPQGAYDGALYLMGTAILIVVVIILWCVAGMIDELLEERELETKFRIKDCEARCNDGVDPVRSGVDLDRRTGTND